MATRAARRGNVLQVVPSLRNSAAFLRYGIGALSIAAILTIVLVITLLAEPLERAQLKAQSASPSKSSYAERHDNGRLTIWTILRELKSTAANNFDQTAWLEQLHTYNSINSWLALGRRVDVILYGDDKTCAIALEFSPSHRLRCVPIPCFHPIFKIPQYDCMFSGASELAQTEFIMYTNSDVMYFDDLLHGLDKVQNEHHSFLIVGQRTDILYAQKIDFHDDNWRKDILEHVSKYGVKHGRFGIDFFVHRTDETRKMPPFLVGRVRWDNWLLAQFIGDIKSVTVDATEVIHAIHLNHMEVGGSHLRNGTDFNLDLAAKEKIDPKKIGDITNTDYILQPSKPDAVLNACPNCLFRKREQPLDVILYKRAAKDLTVIIATVNHGYVDFALNWVCSLQRVGIQNFLFHAIDEKVYQELRDRNLPVVLFESDMSQKYRNFYSASLDDALGSGTMSHHMIDSSRMEFIHRVLQKGYHVLSCDVDVIFLRNPFHFLNMTLDIQGVIVANSTKISDGYAFFRATEKTLALWMNVIYEHRLMITQKKNLPKHHHINNLLKQKKYADVAWGLIDEEIVANGKRFFIDKTTLHHGEWPAVIHNNHANGHDDKVDRYRNISMWLLDDKSNCRPFPRFLPLLPHPPFVLTIKIVILAQPTTLKLLLDALAATDFLGDEVHLDFLVDGRNEEDAQMDAFEERRQQAIAVAEGFQWSHGNKRVVIREKRLGLFGQLVNSWFPQSRNEVALFMNDVTLISHNFYALLKEACLKYFFDPEHFDPRVLAINLQTQLFIAAPGLVDQHPAMLLDHDLPCYKYQLPGTTGVAFLSTHWSQFITWLSNRKAQAFQPLFSNLLTNQWTEQDKEDRMEGFMVWLIRYVAERGLYSIYFNFPQDYSLIAVDETAKQTPFAGFYSPKLRLLKDAKDIDVPLHNGPSIPIYDFHFNRIIEDASILEDRGLYMDPIAQLD